MELTIKIPTITGAAEPDHDLGELKRRLSS
jgi:hypothetical protein